MKPSLSVIVPLFNESRNVPILVEKLFRVLDAVDPTAEIILVDDGSRDDTFDAVKQEAARNDRVRGIKFRRNFGQTAAIKAGVENARGDICITMDGDLQHDPEHIPLFLEKMDEGFDLVCGYRNKRDDGLMRKIPSKVANFLARKISGLRLKDFGSTYRAYRTSLFGQIAMYGEMHRFIPIFFAGETSRITEIPISVKPRNFGKSKYGIGRTFRVFSDLLSLLFFSGFFNRPIHIFGYMAILLGLPGFFILFGLSAGKLFGGISIMDYGPLFILGVLLCLVAGQVFTTGIVCEYLVRIYYKKDNLRPYNVAETTFGDIQPGEDRIDDSRDS